jgi:diguanylate cyclase (GGDEF)-like protein
MTEEMLGLDPLTGLPNYWYMLRELERHIAVYKRYRHPFSLLLLHFDNLKGVKDTWGDTAGDAALAYVATLIQTHVRASDICCQHTEDEFAVIMPETNMQAGETLGRRITDSVVPTTFKVGEASVSVKVRFGTASCPRDGVEPETLLQAAGFSLQGPRKHSAHATHHLTRIDA